MSEEETKVIMDAILGGFIEQKAMIDGLTLGLVKLQGEFEGFRQEVRQEFGAVKARLDAVDERLSTVEQGQADLRAELHEGLNHLGERWLEHDRAIYSLKHRQAAMRPEAQG